MSTLDTSPMLYMTLGSPGSGKTFFARQFAQNQKLPVLSADRIRFELFDQPTYSSSEDTTVARILDYMLEEYLRAGLSVVMDGQNSSRTRRYEIRALARKYHAQCLVVWVQTDRDTAFDRASNRDRRQTDDKYNVSINEETFIRQERLVQKPVNEDYVVISGKHLFTNQQNAVVNKVARVFRDVATAEVKKISLGGRFDIERRKMRGR